MASRQRASACLDPACSTGKTGDNWTSAGPAGIVRRHETPVSEGTAQMTTAASPSPAVRAEVPNDLAAFWLPFTPNRAFKKRPRLDRALQGHALLHARGAGDPRRDCGALVLQRRPQPRADRRRDPAPGGRARFHPDLPVRPSAGVPALLAPRRSRAGRPRSRLLLQLRLGGRRHGAQNRHRLSQRARVMALASA